MKSPKYTIEAKDLTFNQVCHLESICQRVLDEGDRTAYSGTTVLGKVVASCKRAKKDYYGVLARERCKS